MPDFPSDVPNRAAVQSLSGLRYTEPPDTAKAAHRLARPSAYKKGGKVKRSGWAKVHKGERILRAKQVLGGKRRKPKRKTR